MKTKQLIFALIIFLGLGACNSDDDGSGIQGEYAKGIFVVNEGNFGSGNGTIAHYNPKTKEVKQDIFRSENDFALGDVVQSMHVDGSTAYIVVNNSTKVEAVNVGTFKSTATFSSGLANPRYMVISGTKGYISNWGNFDASFQLDQSYVAVVDLKTQALLKKINTQDGTENLQVLGGKLFVANNFTNTVEIINLNSELVEKSVEVGSTPGAMVVDNTGLLWVICGGSWGGNDGKLVAINPTSGNIQSTIALGMNVAAKLTINPANNQLYFYAGKKVYRFANGTFSTFLEISDYSGIYGIGFDAKQNLLYVSDAVGFAANGTVRSYTINGNMTGEFTAGIGPNGFVFFTE